MPTDYIYNPVAQATFSDRISELENGVAAGKFIFEACFFIAGLAIIAAAIVVVAA